MSKEGSKLVGVRITPELDKRVSKLVPKVAKDERLATIGRITKSTVFKLALAEGLAVLEQRYK